MAIKNPVQNGQGIEAAYRVRTCDLEFGKLLLYQLS
jgi:hypothetical protein